MFSCLTSVFYLESPAPLLLYLEFFTYLLSCPISTPVLRSLAILLLFPMFGPVSSYITFTTLTIFKQTLLNKLLYCRSTSLAEFLCPLLLFNLLPNKTNCKWTFDSIFINSHLLSGNYAWEKVDFSFAKCGFFAAIKLNRLWYLKFLDPKVVSIIKAIFFTAAMFCNLLFAPWHQQMMKLTFKPELKTQCIASSVIKEKIELV